MWMPHEPMISWELRAEFLTHDHDSRHQNFGGKLETSRDETIGLLAAYRTWGLVPAFFAVTCIVSFCT